LLNKGLRALRKIGPQECASPLFGISPSHQWAPYDHGDRHHQRFTTQRNLRLPARHRLGRSGIPYSLSASPCVDSVWSCGQVVFMKLYAALVFFFCMGLHGNSQTTNKAEVDHAGTQRIADPSCDTAAVAIEMTRSKLPITRDFCGTSKFTSGLPVI
jgi:hypothetical protein